MYEYFKKFVQEKIADFRRIVWKTKGEVALEDLENEAWLVAHEIGQKRDSQLDLSNLDDQDLVMAALYNKSVKRREKNIQYAVRIDEERSDDEGAGLSLADRLPASANSDPLIFLLSEEHLKEADRIVELEIASSYSEATAYVIALHRFNSREKLCKYMVLSNDALLRRLRKAKATVSEQASLFDRIERISKKFKPLPGKMLLEDRIERRLTTQLSWTFF